MGTFFVKKSKDKINYFTIQNSGKDWPEMDSFSEKRNPDQKLPEIKT